MQYKSKHTPEELKRIDDAIRENLSLPADCRLTQAKLAERYDSTISIIHRRTEKLRQGRRKPKKRPTILDNPQAPTHNTTVEQLLALIDSGSVVDRERRLKVLSHIITSGPPGAAIQASRLMEDIEGTSKRSLGPPPPESVEEETLRIYRILCSARDVQADDAIRAYQQRRNGAQAQPENTLQ